MWSAKEQQSQGAEEGKRPNLEIALIEPLGLHPKYVPDAEQPATCIGVMSSTMTAHARSCTRS